MTYTADVLVDPRRPLGRIDPRIYGQFVEHVGRAVYGGIDPPRDDVLEAVRGLAPTVLRWPGGNFASGYHWRDGVGEDRQQRRDLAWAAIDPNTFGTDEFVAYCRTIGAEPYLNLNMGIGTVDEALSWLEYCNATEGAIAEVALRGGPPHGVTIWGLGNETYGWWQHGHTTAASYGEQAREWAKLLRWTDPDVRCVAVGAPDPDWNWTVLRTAGRTIDWLSLHFYWRGLRDRTLGDPDALLSDPVASERDIVAAHGMSMAAAKALGMPSAPRIAVDEWGVWWRTAQALNAPDVSKLVRTGLTGRAGIDTRFEEDYDLTDALAVASWLHVLWRHPDVVTLATQAQMVNVLAPIRVTPDGVRLLPVYHPLATARAEAFELSLDVRVVTDAESDAPSLPEGRFAALDAAATTDGTRVHVSLVNRSPDQACDARLTLPDGPARVIEHSAEAGDVPRERRTDDGSRVRVPPRAHVTVVA